jgi:hypothetical protein
MKLWRLSSNACRKSFVSAKADRRFDHRPSTSSAQTDDDCRDGVTLPDAEGDGFRITASAASIAGTRCVAIAPRLRRPCAVLRK